MKNLTLKAKIVEKFGTQFKFSHAVGAPEATVSRVINGVYLLPECEKKKWAKKLQSKVSDIFITK